MKCIELFSNLPTDLKKYIENLLHCQLKIEALKMKIAHSDYNNLVNILWQLDIGHSNMGKYRQYFLPDLFYYNLSCSRKLK